MISTSRLLKHDGPIQPGSYIVKLKNEVSTSDHFSLLNSSNSQITAGIKHEYHHEVFKGYSATLNDEELGFLLECEHVESVTEDGYYSSLVQPNDSHEVTEMVFPVEQKVINLQAQNDVDVYMFGTGIFIEHSCFGGRARWGANFTEDGDHDANGHGTHTAGIAVGDVFGQATSANVIAVKVLGDNGSAQISWIIAGLSWAFQQFRASGRPSVVNMSLGGSANSAIDAAVRNVVRAGLSVVANAGNENQDVNKFSPARVLEANTVGVVDENNKKAFFSNYGSTLTVWAPGIDIVSAWIGSPNAVNKLSGSAMAAYVTLLLAHHSKGLTTAQNSPVVTGYFAVALGREHLTPKSLTEELVKNAKPVVTGVPAGTTNLLAQRW
ncbi:subtilisin-like protein [Ceratobasidium sp. AG-I]|nr:subtilisin-like protein [Ceratobasidium sp. AG-I]